MQRKAATEQRDCSCTMLHSRFNVSAPVVSSRTVRPWCRLPSAAIATARTTRVPAALQRGVLLCNTEEHSAASSSEPCTSDKASSSAIAGDVGNNQEDTSRRGMILAAALSAGTFAALLRPSSSSAFVDAPVGLRRHVDKLDGYTFLYPDSWTQVTSSGNDIFLRNPYDVNENVFVEISSPSSSRYETLEQLGTPEFVAEKLMKRYLTQEFMSTRIGIRREGKVLFARARTEDDNRTYYDVAVRISSYASRNPYVASRQEVMREYGLEWDRVLITTLGIANKRLYELRLQASADAYCADGVCGAEPAAAAVTNVASTYQAVQNSFRVREVEG